MTSHNKGDIVYLDIEGAPAMTVAEVCSDGYTLVRWFGSDGALHEKQFHCDELCAHAKAKPHSRAAVHKAEK